MENDKISDQKKCIISDLCMCSALSAHYGLHTSLLCAYMRGSFLVKKKKIPIDQTVVYLTSRFEDQCSLAKPY